MLEYTRGLTRETARAAAEQIFRDGGILTLAGEPGRLFLLGDLRWTDGGIFVFPAYGDGPADARRVMFDQISSEDARTLRFLHDHQPTGTLCRIEDATLEDPDDYRIAWQLWQQVVPLRRSVIERAYEGLEPRIG